MELKATDLFGSMYEQHYPMACRFVKSYVRSDVATEEIVSDSFFEWWQVIEKGDTDHSPALFMMILKHRALDWLKREKVKSAAMGNISGTLNRYISHRIMLLEECDPKELFSENIREIVEETLLTLSPQTRRIFLLSRHEYLSVNEIAERMGMTPKNVEYHITKALKALRVTLKDYLAILIFYIG